MKEIIVAEYAGAMGLLDPTPHRDVRAAVEDILKRTKENDQRRIQNLQTPAEWRVGVTNVEVLARENGRLMPIDRKTFHEIKAGVQEGMETAKRSSSGLVKTLIGAGAAIGTGVAAAAEPGATPGSVADKVAAEVMPGWVAARKGNTCQAFGEATGYVAGGLTVAAGTAATVAATAGGTVTGPGAVAIAVGGAALTVKATESASELGTSLGEEACEAVSSGINRVKSAFGLGGG